MQTGSSEFFVDSCKFCLCILNTSESGFTELKSLQNIVVDVFILFCHLYIAIIFSVLILVK